MAVLSTLVKALSEVEGLEETQVAWIGRHLREAGLIAQGGRGKGGAQMTVADATNLLIGVNAAFSAKDAVTAVNTVRELRNVDVCYPIVEEITADDDSLVRALYQPASAASCLHDLLNCFVDRDKPAEYDLGNCPEIRISFFKPNIRITLRVEEAKEGEEEIAQLITLIEFDNRNQERSKSDKSDRTTISQRTLIALGQALSS